MPVAARLPGLCACLGQGYPGQLQPQGTGRPKAWATRFTLVTQGIQTHGCSPPGLKLGLVRPVPSPQSKRDGALFPA